MRLLWSGMRICARDGIWCCCSRRAAVVDDVAFSLCSSCGCTSIISRSINPIFKDSLFASQPRFLTTLVPHRQIFGAVSWSWFLLVEFSACFPLVLSRGPGFSSSTPRRFSACFPLVLPRGPGFSSSAPQGFSACLSTSCVLSSFRLLSLLDSAFGFLLCSIFHGLMLLDPHSSAHAAKYVRTIHCIFHTAQSSSWPVPYSLYLGMLADAHDIRLDARSLRTSRTSRTQECRSRLLFLCGGGANNSEPSACFSVHVLVSALTATFLISISANFFHNMPSCATFLHFSGHSSCCISVFFISSVINFQSWERTVIFVFFNLFGGASPSICNKAFNIPASILLLLYLPRSPRY